MSEEDESRKAILARRARYIAMAVAGVSTATSATACVCLEPRQGPDAGMRDTNADAPLPDAWLPTLPDSRGPVWPSTDAATEAADDAPAEEDAPSDSDAP